MELLEGAPPPGQRKYVNVGVETALQKADPAASGARPTYQQVAQPVVNKAVIGGPSSQIATKKAAEQAESVKNPVVPARGTVPVTKTASTIAAEQLRGYGMVRP